MASAKFSAKRADVQWVVRASFCKLPMNICEGYTRKVCALKSGLWWHNIDFAEYRPEVGLVQARLKKIARLRIFLRMASRDVDALVESATTMLSIAVCPRQTPR